MHLAVRDEAMSGSRTPRPAPPRYLGNGEVTAVPAHEANMGPGGGPLAIVAGANPTPGLSRLPLRAGLMARP